MSTALARGSRLASSSPKDFDFQFFIYQDEAKYPFWFSGNRVVQWFKSLPDNTLWNCVLCIMALVCIILVAMGLHNPYKDVIDSAYNVVYAVHVIGLVYSDCMHLEPVERTWRKKLGFVVDIITYLHYPGKLFYGNTANDIKLFFYYVRLHRPFRYLWSLNDYNLKGSVVGTALKYFYIFLVLRVTCALVWLEVDKMQVVYELSALNRRAMHTAQKDINLKGINDTQAGKFFKSVYIINRMFIPIGPSVAPQNDYERIMCLLVMITGCLVVTGAAVASLSLVISIYMRPEEVFRARFKLIMKEMQDKHILPELRFKVETFYKMYWHKQRAVSVTQLLPIFPHTLPTAIYTDIYFEAQQKSRILRDLSYQFLWELSKIMTTTNYIPGDALIERSTRKSSIIYITYGDVEMLTAEDDITPILRFTRGTVLSSCGGCASVACARAHVEIRAATFCTAHVLKAKDLWKVALKFGKGNGQNFILLSSFEDHFEKVKKHYNTRLPEIVKHKSSILHFKRNLMALKEAKDANGNLLLARTDIFLEVAGSYIMRNRADSSLTDESDAICLRPTFPCIMQPTSSLQVVWHALVACLIFTVCIVHPYVLVYQKTVSLEFRFFDYVVTGIFVLDLIVHLSTGANVEEGVPITFAQTSSQQMKSHWFVLDVLGTVPIFEFIGEGHFAGINKLLRLPKLFRVLKSLEDVCVYHSNVLRFFSYSVLMLIACYLFAALQQGFMCFQFEHCRVRNFTQSPFWSKEPLDEDNVDNRLNFALYWATSVITFTSHKNPMSNTEYWNILYTMVVLEMCIMLYIFVGAVYSATIMVTTALREDYDSCIGTVKHFLIRNNIDPLLRHRFITYLQLCWFTDKAYSMTHEKSSIFYDLPPHVYQDLVSRQRIRYLLCIPFLKFILKEDLKTIASHARLFYTSPNEILLNTGDITNEMYVIKQGICEILSPDTKAVVNSITAKNHFGALECVLRFPAFYTVRAVTHVQVFRISRKHLLKAMDLPKLKDAINIAKKQPEYSLLLLRREAFVLYEPPPSVPNREHFKLPRKHEPDSAFLQPFSRLGFLSVLRYIFPRYTIRPDGVYLTRYEWFRAVCALSSAMVFPSYTYLQLQWPGLYIIALLLDVSAYFDILQRMLIGFFNEHGILIYHPSSTAAHYIKGAFIVDLFGCLPLENLESSRRESIDSKYHMTPTTQFLMLNRLLQLYRLPSTMDILNQHIERRDIILVIKAIPLFVALINVLSCLMVYCSVDIYRPTFGSVGWFIVPFNDKGGSWITQFKDTFRFNMTESPWNLHLAVYFWIVYETTTTGYNTFNPSNLELIQVLFWGMVIGAMITTYFSVRIISIRANVNKALASFQEHMKDIAVYMRKEKLSKELQREVLAHYEYNWDKMGGTDYRSVLKLCDQITLRTDAILHIYGQTFAKCPILYRCDLSLLRIVGRAVNSMYCLKHTVIISTDNVIANMYFVDYGSVEVTVIQEGITTVIRLQRGSVFGNLDGAQTVRCPTTIVASSNVHLLQMNSQTFYKIILDFHLVKVLMRKYRPHGENYIIGSLHHRESEDSIKTWKERTVSSPLITASRRDLVKHLNIHNKVPQMYLIVVSMLCMYGDIYNAGFQHNGVWLIVTLYLLDMGFYLKILMNYVLPLVVDDPEMRQNLMGARTAYFQSEFKYDIVSCLPIELFSLLQRTDMWWYFALLRLNRMLRIVTVYNCIKRHHEKLSIDLVISTILSVFIWFTLFVHTASCLWYYIGVCEDLVEPGSSWLHNADGPTCGNHYVCSLYFILTTFTQNGVGDFLPRKQSEVIFVIILQIISTMVYMVYVGEFSNIIQYQSFSSFNYYCKYLELQEFLKNNRVARNLVAVVNKYSLHLWREARGVQTPHFLRTAPQWLKLKVMSAAYLHHFTKHPVFKDCEPAFLQELVGRCQLFHYNADMYVVKESEITDAMYMIHKGHVQELDEDMERAVGVYKEGECFGIAQGLARDSAYPYSYRTTTKSQVLTLRLDDWEYLLKHFPESNNVIAKSEYRGPPDERKPSMAEEKQSRTNLQEQDKSVKKHVQIKSAIDIAASEIWAHDSYLRDKTPLSDYLLDESKDLELKEMTKPGTQMARIEINEDEKEVRKDEKIVDDKETLDTKEKKETAEPRDIIKPKETKETLLPMTDKEIVARETLEGKEDEALIEAKEATEEKGTPVANEDKPRETKEMMRAKEDTEIVEAKEPKEDEPTTDTKETMEIKEDKPTMETKGTMETKEDKPRMETKETMDTKEDRPPTEIKEPKETAEGKDTKEITGAKKDAPVVEAGETVEANKLNETVETQAKEGKKTVEMKEDTEVKGKTFFNDKKTGKPKFTPPTGPSLQDMGAPIVVDTHLWPMDSRRRSTMENVNRQAVALEMDNLYSTIELPNTYQPIATEKKSERTLSVLSIESDEEIDHLTTRRKSTIHDDDKISVAKELESLRSTDIDHIDQIEPAVKSENIKHERITLTDQDKPALTSKDIQHERTLSVKSEDEDYEPSPTVLKRRSTMHIVDRQSVARELESLKSCSDDAFEDEKINVDQSIKFPDEESLHSYSNERKSTAVSVTDTEEALIKGAKFIRRMSLAAKSLITGGGTPSSSKDKYEKDTLLREEDERTTQELIEKYEEEELRRSVQSTQSLLGDFYDYEPIKKRKTSSLDVINESSGSLDIHHADSTGSVEGFMLMQYNKDKEKHVQMDELPEVRSKRHSNASQISSRSKRSVRVRYQDDQRPTASSIQSLASHRLPLLQPRTLSDSTPADELTAEERNLRMMDSDLEGGEATQGTSNTADDTTLVPKKSKSHSPKKQ